MTANLSSKFTRRDGESLGVLFDRTQRWLLLFLITPRVGRAVWNPLDAKYSNRSFLETSRPPVQ